MINALLYLEIFACKILNLELKNFMKKHPWQRFPKRSFRPIQIDFHLISHRAGVSRRATARQEVDYLCF